MRRNAAASIVLGTPMLVRRLSVTNVVAAAVLVAGAMQASAVADSPLSIANLPANLFGGAEVVARLDVAEKSSQPRRILWTLEAAEHRALTRGEADLPADGQDVSVRLQLPPVKAGVIVPFVFKATLASGDATPAPATERKLWLFPESPWTNRRELLKERRITLFDPGGATAEILRESEIEFAETNNTAALGELADGMILVGEGIDLREYPDLAGILRNRAAAGLTVICLAPTAGTIPLKTEANERAPIGLRFARDEIIVEFDRRLDLNLGQSSDAPTSRGWVLRGEGADVVLESTDDSKAWPWVEMRFGRGRLVLCHFALCAHWKSGPAPRFFFAQLLQSQNPSHDLPTEP